MFDIVSSQERVNFTKSLAIMLKSGITINNALAELSEQSDSRYFSEIINRIRGNVENGTSLAKSFEKETKTFGTIFVSLIKAGEESGTLQGNLQFLSEWLNRSNDLKREILTATMYPKLVFGAALLLGGSLAVFILPKLVPLFTSLNVELPWTTKTLLAISLWIKDDWILGVVGIIAVLAGILYLNTFFRIRKIFHTLYINIPFMGTLLKNYQRALVTQLFATLLKSGLSLNQSVGIVSEAATNIVYQESLAIIQNNILRGTTLSTSMKHFGNLFPNMMISIIEVGESSGSLVQSFEYLSEFYTKEVNASAKKLPTIIEPLLLILIAVVVGFVALAIIMPIYELTGNIT
jgi:type IV pilus assembly protein PilC